MGRSNILLNYAKRFQKNETIGKVDLFTRLIKEKVYSSDYSLPVEHVNDKFRIIRIQCGGRKYIRKEKLWPVLDEFVDKTIKFIKLEEAIPDILHGHYPDAGYVTKELARVFGIPLFTPAILWDDPKRPDCWKKT